MALGGLGRSWEEGCRACRLGRESSFVSTHLPGTTRMGHVASDRSVTVVVIMPPFRQGGREAGQATCSGRDAGQSQARACPLPKSLLFPKRSGFHVQVASLCEAQCGRCRTGVGGGGDAVLSGEGREGGARAGEFLTPGPWVPGCKLHQSQMQSEARGLHLRGS